MSWRPTETAQRWRTNHAMLHVCGAHQPALGKCRLQWLSSAGFVLPPYEES
jgi:hypothetical protein